MITNVHLYEPKNIEHNPSRNQPMGITNPPSIIPQHHIYIYLNSQLSAAPKSSAEYT
jgi:hypothetical protein